MTSKSFYCKSNYANYLQKVSFNKLCMLHTLYYKLVHGDERISLFLHHTDVSATLKCVTFCHDFQSQKSLSNMKILFFKYTFKTHIE